MNNVVMTEAELLEEFKEVRDKLVRYNEDLTYNAAAMAAQRLRDLKVYLFDIWHADLVRG